MTDAEIIELPEFVQAFDVLIDAIIKQKARILSETEILLVMENLVVNYHTKGHFSLLDEHLI